MPLLCRQQKPSQGMDNESDWLIILLLFPITNKIWKDVFQWLFSVITKKYVIGPDSWPYGFCPNLRKKRFWLRFSIMRQRGSWHGDSVIARDGRKIMTEDRPNERKQRWTDGLMRGKMVWTGWNTRLRKLEDRRAQTVRQTSLSRLAHLERLKDVFNKDESLQTLSSRHNRDDGFPHVGVGLLPTEAEVQVQVRPESTQGDRRRIWRRSKHETSNVTIVIVIHSIICPLNNR